jgi:hypothetical protein
VCVGVWIGGREKGIRGWWRRMPWEGKTWGRVHGGGVGVGGRWPLPAADGTHTGWQVGVGGEWSVGRRASAFPHLLQLGLGETLLHGRFSGWVAGQGDVARG